MLFKIFYFNQDHLCSLFNINHSPITPYSPWTNGFNEVQNRNIGTHLRLFLQNLSTNWSFQTQRYAYAHNTTPLSQRKLSPYHFFSHTHPRIPLTFSLTLSRDSSKKCIASYCDSITIHIPASKLPDLATCINNQSQCVIYRNTVLHFSPITQNNNWLH